MIEATKSSRVLAATAFTLAITGLAMAPAQVEAASKVQCFGVNACKGQAACKSASNSCKGQNACKGHGWISTTADKCKTMGGSTTQS